MDKQPVRDGSPIPRLRVELEHRIRASGAVDVRDPRLYQVYSLDASDFELAQKFDGKSSAQVLAARTGQSVAAIRRVAKVLDELLLLDTPAVKKAVPAHENTGLGTQFLTTEKKLRVLPEPQPEASWACHACGACCHGLAVELTSKEEARIDASLYRDLIGDGHFAEDAFIDPELPARRILRQRAEDRLACIFLLSNGWCAIHARQGKDKKPDACQIFPYVVLELPRQKPRLGMRVNCETMHESSEGPAIVRDRDEVLRILESSPHHRLPAYLPVFEKRTALGAFLRLIDEILAVLEAQGVTPEGLAAADALCGGRVAKARRGYGKKLLAYVAGERKAEVTIEEGAFVTLLDRLPRGQAALEAMKSGQKPPRVSSTVEAFLRRQLSHVFYLVGPANIPDAGLGLVALLLGMEAILHAVGPRGRLKTANLAFMVFTAPVLEMTTHAWPVVEAIDPAQAKRLKEEL